MSAPDESSRACLQCGRPLGPLPPGAPHKRFCSETHRTAWNAAKRTRVREAAEALALALRADTLARWPSGVIKALRALEDILKGARV